MFTVKIRQHIMIAHSLQSPAFGPAQQLHGATYIVDASFIAKKLDKNNIVIDIDKASKLLKQVLSPLNYKNLDDLPQFKGHLTTTEYLARYIHQQICEEVKAYFKGTLKITLEESHVAWASYEGKVK